MQEQKREVGDQVELLRSNKQYDNEQAWLALRSQMQCVLCQKATAEKSLHQLLLQLMSLEYSNNKIDSVDLIEVNGQLSFNAIEL